MSVMVRVSPSQIKTYRLCPRKWAFDKIDHVPRATSVAQQAGIDNHKDIEGWLKENKLPGPIAKQAIRPDYLPTPNPNLLIEQYFERPMLEAASDTVMLGYMDCVAPPKTDALALLCDWKTTKSLRYAMSVEELQADEQAIVYAKVVMEEFGVDAVTARWVYFAYDAKTMLPTGTRKAETLFTENSLVEPWNDIVETVKEIRHHKMHTKKALDLEPNPTACGAFGGCEYLSRCPVTMGQALSAHMHQFKKFGAEIQHVGDPALPVVSNTAPMKMIASRPKKVSTTRQALVITAKSEAQTRGEVPNMNFGALKKNGAANGKAAAPAPKAAAPKAAAPAPKAAAPAPTGKPSTKPPAAAAPTAKGNLTAAPVVPAGGSFADRVRLMQGKNAPVNPPEGDEAEAEAEAEAEVVAAPAPAPKRPTTVARRAAAAPAPEPEPEPEPESEIATASSGIIVLQDIAFSKLADGFEITQFGDLLNAAGVLPEDPSATVLDEFLTANPFDGAVLVDSSAPFALREVLVRHASTVLRGAR